MPVWLIIAVTTLYVLGLFFIAWKGDKTALTTKEIGPFSGVGYGCVKTPPRKILKQYHSLETS